MLYEVSMLIVKPDAEQPQMEKKLKIDFYNDPNDYGNGWRVWIEYKDTGYEEGFDLRYDTDFDEEFAELWISSFVYHKWTGKEGSYDIQKLTIERIEE